MSKGKFNEFYLFNFEAVNLFLFWVFTDLVLHFYVSDIVKMPKSEIF